MKKLSIVIAFCLFIFKTFENPLLSWWWVFSPLLIVFFGIMFKYSIYGYISFKIDQKIKQLKKLKDARN